MSTHKHQLHDECNQMGTVVYAHTNRKEDANRWSFVIGRLQYHIIRESSTFFYFTGIPITCLFASAMARRNRVTSAGNIPTS
jgi:hypothetical protein